MVQPKTVALLNLSKEAAIVSLAYIGAFFATFSVLMPRKAVTARSRSPCWAATGAAGAISAAGAANASAPANAVRSGLRAIYVIMFIPQQIERKR